MNLSRDEKCAVLRQDLMAFTEFVFGYLNPTTEFQPNWHLEVIADRLTACYRGDIKRLMLCVPPRSLKSVFTSIAFPAWLLGHDPTAKIMCVSYGAELAQEFSRACRSVIESSWYRHVFPATRLTSRRPSVQKLTTTAGGVRFATSVGGVVTGRGADYIIIDDPLKPDEAASDVQRQAVNDWYDHSLVTRLNRKDTGRIILMMQRLHMDDLVGHAAEHGHWDKLVLPAIATEPEVHRYRRGSRQFVHRRAPGEALHPERESLAILAGLRESLGEWQFEAQYQQCPVPQGGAIVKIDWFRRYAPEELPSDWDTVVQSWDCANKETELASFSVCTTWGIKNDKVYLLDVFRKRMNYPELKRTAKALALQWRAIVVVIEDRAAGTQLAQELPFEDVSGVRAIKPVGDKVMRMYAQCAKIESGLVHIPMDAPWLAEYVREMATFPKSKYDDQVDSTSQALYWILQSEIGPGMGWLHFMRKEVERMRRVGEVLTE